MTDEKTQLTVMRERLEAAIGRFPEDNPVNRQTVYNVARRLVTDRPQSAQTLEIAIDEIEKGYLAPETETIMPEDNTQPRNRTLPIVGAVVAVAAVAFAGWWFLYANKSNTEFDKGVSGYSADADKVTGYDPRYKYVVSKEGQNSILEMNGSAYVPLISNEIIKVDTSKTYRLTARVRVLTDDPTIGGAKTAIGIATYDANGNLQTSEPGAHRYAALSKTLKASDGWVEAEGLITGEGDESHNQFRPGTKTIRPLALLNYVSPGAITQIDYLRFEEVKAK